MNSFAKLSYLNIFRKFFIFLKYLSDNLSNGEFRLAWISFKYLVVKKSNSTDMVIKTNNGLFHIRKNTIDFKLANSAYEYLVLEKFRILLPSYDLFIDVGANIGTYSIIAAKSRVKCIAFEPVFTNYISLKKNIQLNHLEEFIEPVMIGLAEKASNTKFNYDSLKPGASSIHPIKRTSEILDIELKVFDELNYVSNETDKILIKIDVEGMELNVLAGMEKLLGNKKDICLIIETKHSGDTEIKNMLNQFGDFRFESIDEFNMLATKSNN
ncbi:MAG: hypothetical protein CVU00_03160 [Bacteroidetes bacterium HGW-Bacteroidetes-17]|jgi:FkbM family methyltransferase|nr:MAG: hypothetical protein CVU00_03160 [Bacteroidetes bacterium HGW-Bacteroidetes-17]